MVELAQDKSSNQPQGRRVRRGRFWRAWVRRISLSLLNVLAGAAIVAGILWWRSTGSDPDSNADTAALSGPTAHSPQNDEPSESLQSVALNTPLAAVEPTRTVKLSVDQLRVHADDLLLSGDYAAAEAAYHDLLKQLDSPTPGILYRLALTAEFLRQPSEALDLYRRLIDDSVPVSIRDAARFGQARMWLALQRYGPARDLLYWLLLSGETDGPTAGGSFHLLAYLATQEAFAHRIELDLLDDDAILPTPFDYPVGDLLKLGTQTVEPRKDTGQPGVQVLDRLSDRPASIRIAAFFRDRSVLDSLRAVGEAVDWRVDVPEKLQNVVAARSVTLRTSTRMPWAGIGKLSGELGSPRYSELPGSTRGKLTWFAVTIARPRRLSFEQSIFPAIIG